ncbi:MAG: hypothetical protein WCJ35_13945 [Planctomycetota bacterium]
MRNPKAESLNFTLKLVLFGLLGVVGALLVWVWVQYNDDGKTAMAVFMLFGYWGVAAAVTAMLGAAVGSFKNAGSTGALLGALFGPLGVIVAFALDQRLQCPKCGNRLDGRPEMCLKCQSALSYPVSQDKLRNATLAAAKAGDIVGARANAMEITDESERSGAFRDIAVTQANAGDCTGAKATAMEIRDEDERSQAFRDIAVAQASAGNFVGACDTATMELKDSYYERSQAFRDIAVAQASAGDFVGACATARKVEYASSQALCDIAVVQKKAGDFDGARATAKELPEILCEIVVAQAMAGDLAGAKVTAAEIRSKRVRNEALRQIAIIEGTADGGTAAG